MDFRAAMGARERLVDWASALEMIKEVKGRGATRFLMGLGIPRRTAQYYLAGRVVRDPDRRRLLSQAGSRLLGPIAATRFRASGGSVDVGTVTVQYDDQDAGERHVGHIQLLEDQIEAIADLMEEDDWQAAEEQFSTAVMDAYGADPLTISDYPEGIELL